MNLSSGKNILFFIFVIVFSFQTIYSQSKIEGTVKDSSGNNLAGATVILQSLGDDTENQFSITNEEGKFSFLTSHQEFRIKVSYIGFATYSILLQDSIEENLIIKLSPQVDDLDEIVLNYKPPPIQTKVDTLTFIADQFTDGQEHKLKNLIQKLPGVEYEAGVLSINGKKITTVLIEGDKFFNGSTFLAVENIPANAVKELEFIDDYAESQLLKNLENSDKTVLNLKLKDDKKNFYFGDLELKYGNRYFYKLNPSLFKYSKGYKYAIIGSANNIGAPLENILALQETVLNENMPSTSLLDELKFENKEVLRISEKAIGVAFDGLIDDRKKLSVNIVANDADRDYLTQSNNRYFDKPLLIENRELRRNRKFKNYFAGLGYENQLRNQGLFKINSEMYKGSSYNSRFVNSNYDSESINVGLNDTQEFSGLNSQFILLKKLSSGFTLNSKLFTVLKRDIQNLQISGNDDFLEQFITKDETTGIFGQISLDELGELYFENDLYYSFNSQNNLKLTGIINTSFYKKSLNNPTGNSDSGPASFSEPFNVFSDFQMAGMYSHNNEKFYAELGISMLHRKLPKKSENYFLPTVSMEYKFSFGNEIKLKYTSTSKRPVFERFFEGVLLKDFNHLEFGNTHLSSEKSHNFLFSSLFTDLRKGITFRGDINYQIKENSIIIDNTFSGINLFTRYSNLNIPTNDLNTRLVVGKIFSVLKLNGTIGYRENEIGRILNDDLIIQNIGTNRAKIHFETLFDKEVPNLFFNFTYAITKLKTGDFESKFSSNTYNVGLKNNSGKFTYLLAYEYIKNSNYNDNAYTNLKFNVVYNFENSPWLINLVGENLLDTNYIYSQSIKDTFVTEVQIARLPAMVLLGITYKI